MTGFGESRRAETGHAYQVEIRSVNNRYFKANYHLPDECAYLEADLERLLRTKLTRGSITVRYQVREVGAQAASQINVEAVRAYVGQLRDAVGPDARTTIDLAALLALPGVCEPHGLTAPEREQQSATVLELASTALGRLLEMRAREGAALERDLRAHCAAMRAALARVSHRGPAVIEEYRGRLHARVQHLLHGSGVELAADDLLREVAIYADRSDISEEIARLSSHLEEFERLLEGAEPPGRKLEFVAQEMLREANTMGSKTGDGEIARAIVEMKSAIDRIKEQVQNIE